MEHRDDSVKREHHAQLIVRRLEAESPPPPQLPVFVNSFAEPARQPHDDAPYEVTVPLTIPERRRLERKAKKEMRSLSNYVMKLVLSDLGRKR